MLLYTGQKPHKTYYKDNFNAYIDTKQILITSCKIICWCYAIASIKCHSFQIYIIYKYTNFQETVTFSKYFERETLSPVQKRTIRSINFHLLPKCYNSNSKCSSCMWSYKWDRGSLLGNNKTNPMMDTEYEDKLLSLGFVFRSLWRAQLGSDWLLIN